MYDRIFYATPHYYISVYIIRILNLKFKLSKKNLLKYENIYKKILKQYIGKSNRINHNITIIYQNSVYFSNSDKKYFNKETDKIFINLVLCLLDITNNKLLKKITIK